MPKPLNPLVGKENGRFARARNVPLDQVIARMGGDLAERGDNRKFRIGGRLFVVSAQGYGWFEVGGSGGAGAVDLVARVQDCSPQDAVAFLLDTESFSFPTRSCAPARRPEPSATATEIPEPQHHHWPRVRKWLIETRRLDADIIDQLHVAGSIYAGQYANAVFIGRSGHAIGCEIRGTSSKRFAGRRGSGLFELSPKNPAQPTATVESAIDAISLRMLGHAGRIVSTGGALGERAIEYLKKLPGEHLAAFDADDPGDGFAAKLQAAIPSTRRMRPGFDFKDWNDLLLAQRG